MTDKYESSLNKMMSKSKAQLNSIYILASYMTMGYQIVDINPGKKTITLVDNEFKSPLVMLNYDARHARSERQTGIEDMQAVALMKDIDRHYHNLVSKYPDINFGNALTVLENSVKNYDGYKVPDVEKVARRLKESYIKIDREKIANNIDGYLPYFKKGDLEHKILSEVRTGLVERDNTVENIYSHKTTDRPSAVKGVGNNYTYMYGAVPINFSAENQREANKKAKTLWKENKISEHKKQQLKDQDSEGKSQ